MQPQTVTITQAMDLALQHHRAGRMGEAEQIYRKVLSLDPNRADALHLLGVLAHQFGRAEGIDLIRRAIVILPNFAEAYSNLAVALQAKGRTEEAVVAGRRAVELRPDYPEALSNLANSLLAAGKPEESMEYCRRALEMSPNSSGARNNLGNSYMHMGRTEEALAEYRKAIEITPDYPEAHNNLGAATFAQGKLDEAIELCRKAIALRDRYPRAHYNMSMMLLLRGDYEEGWKEYEHRWDVPGFPSPARPFTKPRWDGSNLNGRTLLLHDEQGTGDAIQFVRYIPLTAQFGGRVFVEGHPPLRRLMQESKLLEGITWVPRIDWNVPPPVHFDVQAPVMSLPLLLNKLFPDSPGVPEAPYLEASEALCEEWGKRIPHDGTFKVGLVWAGRPTHTNDRNRSVPLSLFAPLTREDVTFFSLQVGPAAPQAKNPPAGMRLIDLTEHFRDFADTAALISHLDLVVTVDTGAAHLAGAIGKPVWVLMPHMPDFRWGRGSETTAWYPTMRLFRQSKVGDWSDVIERIVGEFNSLVTSRR